MCEEKQGSYHHGCLREELITVTADMIAEEGVDSVSMRKLSQRIGVSRTAAYRHFTDKTELLAAVAVQGFNQLTEDARNIRLQEDRDVIERLIELCVGYIQFAAANPSHYRLMFGQKVADWRQHPGLIKAAGESMAEVIALIQACQEQNRIKPGSPRDQAYVLLALIHGQSMLLIDGRLPSKGDPEESARLAIQTYLDGVGLPG